MRWHQGHTAGWAMFFIIHLFGVTLALTCGPFDDVPGESIGGKATLGRTGNGDGCHQSIFRSSQKRLTIFWTFEWTGHCYSLNRFSILEDLVSWTPINSTPELNVYYSCPAANV